MSRKVLEDVDTMVTRERKEEKERESEPAQSYFLDRRACMQARSLTRSLASFSNYSANYRACLDGQVTRSGAAEFRGATGDYDRELPAISGY